MMNFNFKEILEMFSGHWRFLSFLVLVGALVGSFVIVPLAESWFNSDRKNCSVVLDENEQLLIRLMEISRRAREYERMRDAQRNLNLQQSERMVESALEDSIIEQPVNPYANEIIEKKKESLIKDIGVISEVK